MARWTDAQIDAALAALDGWTRRDDAIHKVFAFGDFPEAVRFVAALVAPAEAADHHPDLAIHYRRVTVSYTTHALGGLTAKDFAGARDADAAAERVRRDAGGGAP